MVPLWWQDVYIMMSMTVLVVVCIWHAVIPQIAADWGLELAHTSDVIVLVVLGSIFVIIHVIFALWIAIRVRTRHCYNAIRIGLTVKARLVLCMT